MIDPADALESAKIKFLGKENSVFLSSVLFSLNMCWDDMLEIPEYQRTLYVSGTTFGINKKFFVELEQDFRVTALAHETWHICLKHISRRGDRHPLIFNFAGDYLINLQLYNTINKTGQRIYPIKGGVTVEQLMDGTGSGWLLDPKYEGYSTDEIYDDLYKTIKSEAGNSGKTVDELLEEITPEGFMDDIRESDEDDAEDDNTAVNEILIKAEIAAKMAGEDIGAHLPKELIRYLDSLAKPELPWQVVLAKHLNSFTKDDYSYQRPNMYFMENEDNIILPGMYSEGLGELAVIDDASGSVGDDDLAKWVNEVRHAKKLMNPETLHLLSFDTRIRSNHKFGQYDPIPKDLVLKGGGGTEIRPVIDWLVENKPSIAVIFTDGYFRDPEIKYHGNLIWIIYGNPSFKTKFGKVIHYN